MNRNALSKDFSLALVFAFTSLGVSDRKNTPSGRIYLQVFF